MLRRLLRADLRRGRAIVATLTALIALASMLMAASTSLIVATIASTNRLSQRAEVPDLVQMHSGDADPQAIGHWASSHALIRDYEVIKTLPVPRHQLWISGTSQAGTYHEPAFVTANERIDLLLDEDGRPVRPSPGEVALPVHYQATGAARIGDTVTVDTGDWRLDLTVVDFVRDAQMNAAMIPSKRVVVSDQDYAALEERLSEPEYLIEFTLTQDAKPGTVLAEYKAAGLPSQGISITASMISLMNALSTMLIAAVTLLVALVLMTVSVLALRYTILAAIEADLAQIAVLKAIGAPQPRIRVLYLMKYLVLAAAGSLVGYLLGLPLASVLGAATTTYLGRPPTTVWTVCLPILSVLALAAAIVCLTWLTLRRVGRISPVQALRSGAGGGLRRRRGRWSLAGSRRLPVHQWLGVREALRPTNALLLGVLTLCTITMVLPTNVSTTLEDPRIATYLGGGNADLRIDVRAGSADLAEVESAVAADDRIARSTTIVRRDYTMRTADDQWESVLIDVGEHNAFPMNYLSGRAPQAPDEISLSYNQADVAGAQVGSTVTIRTGEGERDLRVTGVYQDITNNGLTAKAVFDDGSPALWQIIYADLTDPGQEGAVSKDLTAALPAVQVTGVSQYASQFFGATSSQLRVVATMSILIAAGLAFLITALFAVLVLTRERNHITALRAIGSTGRDIAGQYFTRFGVLALAGIGLGMALTLALGEPAIGLVLGSRGAPEIDLLINPWLVGLALPAALALSVAGAVALALRRLRTMTPTSSQ